MNPVDRRAVLRSAGAAAAALALRRSLFAFPGGLAAAGQPSASAPQAKTRYGSISGTLEDGINVFRSIPYGADTAPVRFQAPQPPTPWTGVKVCDAFTTRAPQLTMLRGPQGTNTAPSLGPAGMTPAGTVPRVAPEAGIESEDCLHLNVYTPALRDHRKRPVLVYFHGGAYNNGSVNSPLYDGKRLCHRGDVVVVTVNHRLNAFGFLYLGALDPKQYPDSGNVGMLDLVLALKWVRENIAEFGGDASRVLIFGQSGGGAKCATLMAMPAGHGLFHRVMTMSGQQVKGASIEIASRRTEVMLGKLGIAPANLADLKTVPWQKIQAAAIATSSDWLPVVDNIVLSRDPFTPDAPPLSQNVPMILGNVHDETAVPARGTLTWDDAPAALKNAVAIYLGSVLGGRGDRQVPHDLSRQIAYRNCDCGGHGLSRLAGAGAGSRASREQPQESAAHLGLSNELAPQRSRRTRHAHYRHSFYVRQSLSLARPDRNHARRTGRRAAARRRHVGHADSLRRNRQSQPSRSAQRGPHTT